MSNAKWFIHNATDYAGVGVYVEADTFQLSFKIDDKTSINERSKNENVVNINMSRSLALAYLEGLGAALKHQE